MWSLTVSERPVRGVRARPRRFLPSRGRFFLPSPRRFSGAEWIRLEGETVPVDTSIGGSQFGEHGFRLDLATIETPDHLESSDPGAAANGVLLDRLDFVTGPDRPGWIALLAFPGGWPESWIDVGEYHGLAWPFTVADVGDKPVVFLLRP